MKRLVSSYQHYSMLKTKKSDDYDEIFTRFMNEVYNEEGKGLIDDYIHFKQHHEHELERINRELRESNAFSDCSILECEYTKRHMDEPSASCTETSDAKLLFYEETFDALHFHLFHCFEAGLRVRMRDDNDEMDEEEEKATNDEYFDAQFARLNRRILDRHGNTASFDRFSPKNNKFNIVKNETHDTNKKNTYLDDVVQHLLVLRVDEMQIKQFIQFVNEEEYDTDGIEHDHAIKPNGNISSSATQNQTLLKYYDEFIKDTKLQSSSFNIGFRFYYWPSYEDGKLPTDDEYSKQYNIWDHSGYSIKDLFIEEKYASFKEEIAHYKYVTLTQYKTKITVKITHYLQAEVFRQTTATLCGTMYCSYDIEQYDPM
eukprot:484504_1